MLTVRGERLHCIISPQKAIEISSCWVGPGRATTRGIKRLRLEGSYDARAILGSFPACACRGRRGRRETCVEFPGVTAGVNHHIIARVGVISGDSRRRRSKPHHVGWLHHRHRSHDYEPGWLAVRRGGLHYRQQELEAGNPHVSARAECYGRADAGKWGDRYRLRSEE